jgi:hypothetical protein
MGIIQDVRMFLAHPRPVIGTATGNWNSGIATSGQPGADLFTYGAANQWWQLSEGYFRLFPGIWNIAAVITVRAYLTLMGVEVAIGDEDWDADGTDGQVGIFYWFWIPYEIFGPLRVELYSDQAADDGVVVPYEYRVKSW